MLQGQDRYQRKTASHVDTARTVVGILVVFLEVAVEWDRKSLAGRRNGPRPAKVAGPETKFEASRPIIRPGYTLTSEKWGPEEQRSHKMVTKVPLYAGYFTPSWLKAEKERGSWFPYRAYYDGYGRPPLIHQPKPLPPIVAGDRPLHGWNILQLQIGDFTYLSN
ncbi:hypothetical protein DL770_003290 [Monosporascus sp. CRB-9-2]|nr:hypothetical protein DL770_003290 [Monosporascus sp. CRB-9-2]